MRLAMHALNFNANTRAFRLLRLYISEHVDIMDVISFALFA